MAAPARIAVSNGSTSLWAARLAARLAPAADEVTLLSSSSAPSQSSVPRSSQSPPIREKPRCRPIPKRYFSPSPLQQVGQANPGEPPDPNKVKLGKTLRILQERLPTLLHSPLPQEILAPNISLHLFPTTHPHLPTVSGRVAYTAALWTSPIAWNRLPIVGDVNLQIMTERMVKEPLPFAPERTGAIPEKLVVRWCSKSRTDGAAAAGATPSGTTTMSAEDGEFTGLFVFQFDDEGRILSHTIEHVQEGGSWEKGVGAKFVDLTDKLLGGIKGGRGNEGSDTPLPVCQRLPKEHGRTRR